jgi:hypothetical protein
MPSAAVWHAASPAVPEAGADGDPDPEVPEDCEALALMLLDGAPDWLVLPEWQAVPSDRMATAMTTASSVPLVREIVRI